MSGTKTGLVLVAVIMLWVSEGARSNNAGSRLNWREPAQAPIAVSNPLPSMTICVDRARKIVTLQGIQGDLELEAVAREVDWYLTQVQAPGPVDPGFLRLYLSQTFPVISAPVAGEVRYIYWRRPDGSLMRVCVYEVDLEIQATDITNPIVVRIPQILKV